MRHKLFKPLRQEMVSDDTTIFDADFIEGSIQKKHLAAQETTIITILALLVLAVLFGAVIFTLRLF